MEIAEHKYFYRFFLVFVLLFFAIFRQTTIMFILGIYIWECFKTATPQHTLTWLLRTLQSP